MTHQIFQLPKAIPISSGVVLPGAKASFYLTTTTTPTPVYTTSARNVAHTQPVEADAAGVLPAIYLDPDIVYKVTLTNAAGVLYYTQDPANDQLLSQLTVGGALYPINTAEQDAGLTTSDLVLSYAYGDVRRYGMVGDWDGASGTDNEDAFRNACLYLNAGGSFLDFGNGRYRMTAGGSASLSDISDRTGITLYSDGAELVLDGSYTGSQVLEVFKFTDCTNVSLLGGMRFTVPTPQPAGQAADRGAECFKFVNGCENINLELIETDGCRAAVFVRRGSTSDAKGKNIVIGKIKITDTGYGYAAALSGDNVNVDVETLRAVRSFYVYGVDNITANVTSKDFTGSGDCLIAATQGLGTSGINLSYTNLESTVADASINCVKVSFSDETPAVHRDIRIKLNVSAATASDYLGYGVHVEKLDNSEAHDTVDRGHILEGLEVSGQIIAKNGNHRMLGICSDGTWSTGEFVRNIRIHDLRMSGGGQPVINLASLKDRAVIDNVYSSAQINITGNTSSKIVCVGVESDGSMTSATSDTSLVSYIGCKFGSTVNQSTSGKTFLDCEGLGTGYTGTLTGCTTSPTATVGYTINGDQITLDVPALTATSNANTCTITGAPALIRPTANRLGIARYTDNGTDAIGLARMETDGTLRLFNSAGSSSFFTGSGTKGVPAYEFRYRK